MNRRGFLRGAISVMAMAAILKGRVESKYTRTTYSTAWSDPDLRFTDPDAWFLMQDRMNKSLEDSMIEIASMVDDRGIRIRIEPTRFIASFRQSPPWVGRVGHG